MAQSSSNTGTGEKPPRTLAEIVVRMADERPDSAGFFSRDDGGWHGVTYREFYGDVSAAARWLKDHDVKRGDRVAIIARPCYEWEVADKAIMFLGAITVGLDPKSSADDIAYLLGSSSPVGLFVEDRDLLATVGDVRQASLSFVAVMQSEPSDPASSADGSDRLHELRMQLRDGDRHPFSPVTRPDDVGVIIFTSGTTGRPKGIPLTHRKLVHCLPSLHETFREDLGDDLRTISWVPLYNGTGRLMGSANLILGVRQYFLADPTVLFDAIQEVEPDYQVVMPRILEKVYQQVQQRLESGSRITRAAVRTLLSVRRRGMTSWLAPLADRLLLKRIRHAIWGRRLEFLISGAAPVDPDILRFFDGLGVPTLEVYGLSEIPALATMNRRGRIRYGSVGEPTSSMEIDIAPDGEVMIRSEAAMAGYWGEETNDLLDNRGYLKTGDLGELRDGYLYLMGRKKEIIKTSTGLRISPVEVEQAYKSIPGIDQFVVIGSSRPYLTALVAMEPHFVERLERTGQSVTDYLNRAIEEGGARRPSNRRVQRFAVLDEPLSVEKGEMTPTLKLRRAVIEERFQQLIDELYNTTRAAIDEKTATARVG